MDLLDEASIKISIIVFIWLECLWELYLSYRQHKFCVAISKVPKEIDQFLSQETFDRSKLYTLDKIKFSIAKDLYSVAISTLVIKCGVLAYAWNLAYKVNPWDGEIYQSFWWLIILNTFSTFISLPFSIYNTFVLEEKYGFNKQTIGFFIKDKLKAYALSQVISVILVAVAVNVIRSGGKWFFVWLWGVLAVLILIFLTVYPAVIAPLFDKYEPLPEGELRTAIENLASELKFPLAQLYVVEGSKRSAHSNAFVYGLHSKRIVLFDTLIKSADTGECHTEEILAVLAHELGHWKLSHITKYIVIHQVNLFLMIGAFALIFHYQPIYQALGFAPGVTPIIIGLVAVFQYILAPYNAILSFAMSILSRSFEYQADEFANSLGKAEDLKKALTRLHKDNLGFPIYDSWYSAWHHSHPSLIERLNALSDSKKTK